MGCLSSLYCVRGGGCFVLCVYVYGVGDMSCVHVTDSVFICERVCLNTQLGVHPCVYVHAWVYGYAS